MKKSVKIPSQHGDIRLDTGDQKTPIILGFQPPIAPDTPPDPSKVLKIIKK